MTVKKDLLEKEIKRVLNVIKTSSKKISDERDKLRELNSELNDLLDSFNRGVEELDEGARLIESGIDALSELN